MTQAASTLRGLARAIEETAAAHFCYSQVIEIVRNCTDHITAIAAFHEVNSALASPPKGEPLPAVCFTCGQPAHKIINLSDGCAALPHARGFFGICPQHEYSLNPIGAVTEREVMPPDGRSATDQPTQRTIDTTPGADDGSRWADWNAAIEAAANYHDDEATRIRGLTSFYGNDGKLINAIGEHEQFATDIRALRKPEPDHA